MTSAPVPRPDTWSLPLSSCQSRLSIVLRLVTGTLLTEPQDHIYVQLDRDPAQCGVRLLCLLDAFDFFILVFVLSDLAGWFHTDIANVSISIMLTLAVRPIGALLFGRLAEKFGRRPILTVNVLMFSLFELLSAWSPTLGLFIAFRVIYGIAMGGIWGVASSLAMETIPDRSRGLMSGIFQAGYPGGYLLASIIYGLFYALVGWRGMFLIGALPVLLLPFIYFKVPESPVWLAAREREESVALLPVIRTHWKLCVYLVVLMACFNFFSHGTQDLYPTVLKVQHGFDPHAVSLIAIGAFLMQFMVQGAWGVIPSYLTELVPANSRAVLPGFVYQLGNLLASVNATLQATVAESHGNNYGLAMALVAGTVAILIAILVSFGRETRGLTISGSVGAQRE